MFVLVFKYLTPKGFRGLTLYPFVFLKDKSDKENVVLLNHECIHIRQQIELLVVPFLVWYILEYLVRLLQFRDRNLAYRNISFEREAYQNEKNLHYLKQRSFWSFINYL
jgi:hypothetical protein